MRVGQYCKRAVASIDTKADVAAAARLMREEHVGFLVVYDQADPLRKPVGVLTDRDIVLEAVAQDVDARAVLVQDIMTRQPMTATDDDDLRELVQAMRLTGVRRVPVVDECGALVGVIAIDDAIDVLSEMLCDIAGSFKNEQRQEWRMRPA